MPNNWVDPFELAVNESYYSAKKSATMIIENEVHLIKKDEKRKFDYPIKRLIDTNVYIKIDPSRNSFYIYDKNNTVTDDHGFIRVVVTYEAYA